MGVQGQKDLSKVTNLMEMARWPEELLPVLGLPYTSQYPVTSKLWQVSNGDIGSRERVVAEQHELYLPLQSETLKAQLEIAPEISSAY